MPSTSVADRRPPLPPFLASEAGVQCNHERVVEGTCADGKPREREDVVIAHYGDLGQLIEKRYTVSTRSLGK